MVSESDRIEPADASACAPHPAVHPQRSLNHSGSGLGGESLEAQAEQEPLWREPEFAQGAREMAGVALGIAAWGLVTGVAMVKSGLGVGLALFMSLFVYAGSAQLASLPLIASGAPIWVVWATALCVNLRFVIFSAQWRPYFMHLPLRQRLFAGLFAADLNFVLFLKRYPQVQKGRGPDAYFWGGAWVNWAGWQIASVTGILLADVIPPHWGFGFAGTLALLGLACSLLMGPATWLSGAIAGGAAVAAFALPFKLNIVVAIACAVVVGIIWDHLSPESAT